MYPCAKNSSGQFRGRTLAEVDFVPETTLMALAMGLLYFFELFVATICLAGKMQ